MSAISTDRHMLRYFQNSGIRIIDGNITFGPDPYLEAKTQFTPWHGWYCGYLLNAIDKGETITDEQRKRVFLWFDRVRDFFHKTEVSEKDDEAKRLKSLTSDAPYYLARDVLIKLKKVKQADKANMVRTNAQAILVEYAGTLEKLRVVIEENKIPDFTDPPFADLRKFLEHVKSLSVSLQDSIRAGTMFGDDFDE